MEKIANDTPEYKSIKNEYSKIIENITRDSKFDKFIGGLPITLEQKDLFTIMSKSNNKLVGNDCDNDGIINYRYTATQKVDGSRYLMFINYKTETGGRNITFIDRNNDFYVPKNISRETLPTFDGPKLLIDGELIAFDKEGKVINPLSEHHKIKSYSFLTFDILYGPIEISYRRVEEDMKLIIGSEGAMAGPIGGAIWNYQSRYDILNKLIWPSQFNNGQAILTNTFKSTEWFTVEIKPIYPINCLKINSVLYSNNGFFQKELVKWRKDFYTKIGKEYNKVSLDGLIFTPFDSSYVIGPWKKFLNIQYKWKPIEQQSIDFAIINKTLNVKIGNKLVPFIINNEKVKGINIPNNIKNGTIGEFVYINKQFRLEKIRDDKEQPNALVTVLNVWNSIKNPVKIEDIKNFFILDKLSKDKLESLIKYLTKQQLIQCSLSLGKFNLLTNEQTNDLKSMITTFKNNSSYEFELRIGYIEKTFQPNIPLSLYKQFIDILSFNRIPYSYSNIIDAKKNNIRSRYIYIPEFKSWEHIGTINKEKIKNINIDTKYIYNLDLRLALSNENMINDNDKVNFEDAELLLSKNRYSFDLGLFVIDCTETKFLKYIEGQNLQDQSKTTYSIEIELKNRTESNDIIISKLQNIIQTVLSQIS